MFENVQMPDGMNPEVLSHLMSPQNYGKLDDPSCIGVTLDEKTGEYVIFYLKLDGEVIKDVSFATNGCQDTVVIGSMFTSMIKGQTIEFANNSLGKIADKLGVMSKQQELCAELVLNSFVAALINLKNIEDGKKEEMHVIKTTESCEIEENKEESNE
jgi:nitrogen fixation NifU-like protein